MKHYLILIIFLMLLVPSASFAQEPSIKVTKSKISTWDMVFFRGDGMHGFHNVEIIVSNDYFYIKLLTQSTDRGHFFVPWIIPDHIKAGNYTVVATDNINEVITNIEI